MLLGEINFSEHFVIPQSPWPEEVAEGIAISTFLMYHQWADLNKYRLQIFPKYSLSLIKMCSQIFACFIVLFMIE